MAAGLSERFGRNKLLEPFRGRPLLRWTVEAALRSRLLGVAVVLGHEQERIRRALADLVDDTRLSLVFNPSYRDGQSRSVVAGLSALVPGSGAAMFLVGDQPLLDHLAIDRLIGAFEAAGSEGICYPLCDGRRANPVIFASRFFPALKELRGDGGGRPVIDGNRDAWVQVEFVSDVAFRDVDHPADLDGIEDTAQACRTSLVQALGLETSRVISICGSGGKTSLMAALMRDFALDPTERLLATTTTKMGLDERDCFGRALQAGSAADILAMTQDDRGPVLAYRRLDCERGRLRGFAAGVIDDLARSGRFTRILVEADGSRRHPLKAPDADEPVFPAVTDTVIAVVGLSGLGCPLCEETVFRPDRWSALTGLTPGDPVTPESLAQVIAHPDGLMRQAPPQARRIVFLNQADGSDQMAMADKVIDALERLRAPAPARIAVAHLKPQPCLRAIKTINIKNMATEETTIMTMDECPPDAVNAADEILGPTLARGHGDDIAILFRDERISFNRLDAEVTRFGNALRPYVEKGDRVLLLLKDSPVFVAAHLGAMRIGAVAVALNVRSSAQDLAFVIGDSEAKVLLLDDEFVPLYERAVALTERRPDVVAVVGAAKPGLRSLGELLARADTRRQPATTVADDMAFWLYTSGTTGKPKAAIHCHGDVTVGDVYMDAFGFGPGERVFSSSKLFFAFSLGHVLIGALRFGCTIILYDGWPDSAVIAGMVERYRPTIMLSVPAFYRTLLQDGLAAREEFKTVRCYLSAGEALPETLYRRWYEATGVPIVEGIGATETIFMMVGGTPADHRPGATGKPLPYAETRLLDGQEQPVLATDSPGILWARMGSLCRGYWRRPEATGIAFRDGWFRTGDVFTIDGEGWWYHQGRADDLLKISGQWVSPTEIEECAVTVPGVAEAIVVGVQDEEQLVRLNMFLVAPGGGSAELQRQVQDKLLQTLSQYKCPRRIVFIDAAPRTTTGKVRRFRLRQWAAGRYLQRLIAAIGLDAAGVEQAEPQLFQTMQRKCVLCECYERCDTDLSQGASGSHFQDYCPNSDILVTLRVSPQAH